MCYCGPLSRLWNEEVVRMAWNRGKPENLDHFFSDLDRFFDPAYVPSEQDIARVRDPAALRNHEMVLVDVGGQKSERRKWIHCFQDVTAIFFIASLSGYDQCLIENRDAIKTSDIKDFFPPRSALAGRDYFKKRFGQLAQNPRRATEREIYIHVTTEADPDLFRMLTAAVE
ncbi:G-protein alpha subunit-domain-containing protein, partial [Mycena galopus ATCC 62051]